MTKVVLAGVPREPSQEEIRSAVHACAEAVTDFSWLSPGDSVFIKPALNSGRKYPSTTSPPAIAAMVGLLKEKGAGRVVLGDMSGIEHVKLTTSGVVKKNYSRRLMEECGMAEAAQQAGAELHFFDEHGWDAFYEEHPISGTHWKGPIMMPNILKTMDHIVLMPRCGRHALAGNTLGLKAAVGYWRTDTRFEYHRDAKTFHEKTAETNNIPTIHDKQRLVISAADKILSSYGPDKGYVISPSTGLVMASQSTVAHDMVSLAWLLLARRDTPAWQKSFINDPHSNSIIVNVANRFIAGELWGYDQIFNCESLSRNDAGKVVEDRALRHAFQLMGGIPSVNLEVVYGTVPNPLVQSLNDMITA